MIPCAHISITHHDPQFIYTANKVFRIVEPNGITPEKQVEINIPVYNSFGKVVSKHNDYATAKFDVRVVAGSTLPVNRWAYLEELKELMKMGVVDDVAVLADNGFATNTAGAEVTVTATDLSTSDSFFESVNYIGAVSDQDTDSSWYKWVEAAVTAANAD